MKTFPIHHISRLMVASLALLALATPLLAAEAPVDLGSAAGFVVLGATTITINGNVSHVINGDVGVWPGTSVVGVPPVRVVGQIYAGDPEAALAQFDLTTAYLDAEGRSTAPVTLSGNIGGRTLAPGLYKSTSSLEISSGDLTLDAQGDSTAVYIFQIASTFGTTPGRRVILAGGANPANIFWQVGSSATFGTTSEISGTVMAAISITFNTGARLTGRALAQNGAVTLDAPASFVIEPPDALTTMWMLE